MTLGSAFEMARVTPYIVGLNLSSPEDETSESSYDFQMQMIGFLYEKYVETGLSPLHITLHAGEITDEYRNAPAALTHHVRDAVGIAHAERDVLEIAEQRHARGVGGTGHGLHESGNSGSIAPPPTLTRIRAGAREAPL